MKHRGQVKLYIEILNNPLPTPNSVLESDESTSLVKLKFFITVANPIAMFVRGLGHVNEKLRVMDKMSSIIQLNMIKLREGYEKTRYK